MYLRRQEELQKKFLLISIKRWLRLTIFFPIRYIQIYKPVGIANKRSIKGINFRRICESKNFINP